MHQLQASTACEWQPAIAAKGSRRFENQEGARYVLLIPSSLQTTTRPVTTRCSNWPSLPLLACILVSLCLYARYSREVPFLVDLIRSARNFDASPSSGGLAELPFLHGPLLALFPFRVLLAIACVAHVSGKRKTCLLRGNIAEATPLDRIETIQRTRRLEIQILNRNSKFENPFFSSKFYTQICKTQITIRNFKRSALKA